jgi:hypothetical protein
MGTRFEICTCPGAGERDIELIPGLQGRSLACWVELLLSGRGRAAAQRKEAER